MADKSDERPWWRRFRKPKPDLKLEELEAKLRAAERKREDREGTRGEGE